jgi:hypothetical protein
VLDDSFMLRYSSGKLKLKKLRDSAHDRYAYGFNVVLLSYSGNKSVSLFTPVRLLL